MKFYQVMTDNDLKVFKLKSLARAYITELKNNGETNISFDSMIISVDSDTILDILNGNGYCSEIIRLDKD